MRKFAARIGNGIFRITAVTVTNCGFRSVGRTSCVIIGNIVYKPMSEGRFACKCFCSLFSARARIIILRRFGAGCFRSKVLLLDFLFGKRMRMFFFTATDKTKCRT